MGSASRSSRWFLLVGVALFGATFLSAFSGMVSLPTVTLAPSHTSNAPRYVPRFQATTGSELVLVYIGASRCGPSNVDYLPATVEGLKLILAQKAAASGRSFAAVGVAVDWSTEEGVAHLAKYGQFDEVMAGRKWLNVGSMKYMWEDLPGMAATPQVLVIDQYVEVGTSDDSSQSPAMTPRRLVVRKVGADVIQRWLEHGAPLPRLDPPQATPAAQPRDGES